MRRPKVRMIRNRRVFRIEALRRGIEKMKTFGAHTRDHLRRRAAPGERFSHAEQPARSRYRRQYRVRIEWFHRAKIDDFHFKPIPRELRGGTEGFLRHHAVA